MRSLVNILGDTVLPIVDGDLITVIEIAAEARAQDRSLPSIIGKANPGKRKQAWRVMQDLFDWRNTDTTILGYLYESLLEPVADKTKQGTRRKGGIFYTPPYITEFLVSAAVDSCKADLDKSFPRVLDPACGSGAFLIAAFRELRRRYSDQNPRDIAVGCLYGVDSDPGAVHVARIAVWIEAGLDKKDWKFLEKNIHQGDSLVDFIEHKRDRFEIVVGNPPYRNVKRGIAKGTREFCKSHYRCVKGQWDISAPFVELTLEHLLVPGGACGFIVPNPILLAENYQPLREIILENELIAFGPAGKAFDDPGVEASLLVASAGHSKRRVITILDGRKGNQVAQDRKIPQSLIHRLPFNIFSHLADRSILEPILDALDSGMLARFGDLVTLTRGIECGKKDPRVFPFIKEITSNMRPLIAGESVSPYRAQPSHMFRLPEGKEHKKILKDEGLWEGESQLLLRRVADKPIAAVVSPGSLVLNTLYVIVGDGIDKWATCALLNSEFFLKIYKQLYAFDDRLFPYLRMSQLKRIPVPPDALMDAKLARWSKSLHGIAREESGSMDSKRAGELMERINLRVGEFYTCG